MGDFDGHGSSNGCTSHDSELKDKTKVKFSEDEEMLIARMFNLVGQSTVLMCVCMDQVVFNCWENPWKDSGGDREVLAIETQPAVGKWYIIFGSDIIRVLFILLASSRKGLSKAETKFPERTPMLKPVKKIVISKE
ncbi:hypothetical protein Goarm_005683 [Gossypium armourianum]|uniref:Uncharacterized protein n=1 Tax=Gossypium armourianum TaxID=34283 RepID=A0A7J9K0U2_9ROSI|nr:hypothetical protein [Gossypium armourianum]